jgi:gliding motility-associated-like protein
MRFSLRILWVLMLHGMCFSAMAQSGGWDAIATTGVTGYTDHGNGVIQLLDTNQTGCAATAVHVTSDKYDPCSGTVFEKCYQVFFGCPGDDEIGSDQKGDGMAFSFSKCAYNISNGLACGGGLGYMGACAQMITIEFDTWSSQGNAGFDTDYEGIGNEDEIAIHRDGNASDAYKIVGANPGNLEDGLEHTVCIRYDPATHLMAISIDGRLVLEHDFTGSPYDLQTYFGCGGLNQTWSSGKHGATNPSTVSDGMGIGDQLNTPLCPANVVITAPVAGSVMDLCDDPVAVVAVATPPAGNTIDYVEFFIGTTSIGTANAAPYEIIYVPEDGEHSITAVAFFTPSGSSVKSDARVLTVNAGIQKTNQAPVIDGVVEDLWQNYTLVPLDKVPVGTVTSSADLSANYRAMRDNDFLYVLVEVVDDVLTTGAADPWDNDGIEIFVDIGNGKNPVYGPTTFQYAFVYNSAAVTEYKNNATAGVVFSQGTHPGGYLMEVSIPWTTLGADPQDGELIGFDVHVNDDDGDGIRDTKIAWYDTTDDAHHSPAALGVITASPCNPCPFGRLAGDSVLCDDAVSTVPLSVSFEGRAPWTFTYSIDGVEQAAIAGITVSPYLFPSQTGAHQYELVSVANPYTTSCKGNALGTARVRSIAFPVGINNTFVPPASTLLRVEDHGEQYEWYSHPVHGSLLYTGTEYTTPLLNDTTKYYVQQKDSIACRTEVIAIPQPPVGVFFIPNLVTPNGDGKNDRFEITALPIGAALKVFNRWGDYVYQSTNYDNLWAAHNLSDGVYYYDLTLPDGSHYKGWLQVVR